MRAIRSIAKVMATALLVLAGAWAAMGAELWWGGGTVNIVNGTAVNPVLGNWTPGTPPSNWSTDASGTTYVPWVNANNDSARIGFTAATPYTITITANTTNAGITAYQASGTGGTVTLATTGTGTYTFRINSGSTLTIPTGMTLAVSMASNNQTFDKPSFTLTGGGLLSLSNGGGTFTGSGIINVANGTIRMGSTSSGQLAGNTVNLAAGTGFFECNQSSGPSQPTPPPGPRVQAITGSGTVRTPSTAYGQICNLNIDSSNSSALDAFLLNGDAAGFLGLVKSGTGTVTVNNSANSYSGGTVIRAGMLVANAAGAVRGPMFVQGGTFSIAAAGGFAAGTGGINVEAGGTVLAANLADVSRIQLLPGGILRFDASGDIPGTGRTLPDAAQNGAVLAAGYPINNAFLNRVKGSFNGVIALGVNSANNLDFNTDAGGNLPNARLGAAAPLVTYSGTLTPNGSTYRLGGAGTNLVNASTLVLDQNNALTGARSLDIGNGGAKGEFNTVVPVSGVTLTGANDMNGAVAVGRASTLTLSGASPNGGISGATGVTLKEGGTLTLASTAAAANSDRLPTVGVTFQRGGALNFTHTGNGATEDLGNLTVDGGLAIVSSALASGGVATPAIRFASLPAPANYGNVRFAVGGSTRIQFVADPAPVNGMIAPWALSGTELFATYTPGASETIATYVTTNVATATMWQNCTANTNVNITGTFVATVARTVNSLRMSSGGALSVTLTGLNTINSGGIIFAANTGTITGGSLTTGASNNGLYFHTSNRDNGTISSAIVDNGNPVTVVKTSGTTANTGTLILSGANTFTGGLVINSGSVQIGAASALRKDTPVIFNGVGTQLSSPGTAWGFTNNITVNADAFITVGAGAGGIENIYGNIALNNGAMVTFNGDNRQTMFGQITGTGMLRAWQKTNGNPPLQLFGSLPNTFSGPTIVGARLELGKPAGVDAIPGDMVIGTSYCERASYAQKIVILTASDQIANTSVVTLYGGQFGYAGVLRLNNFSETIAGLQSLVGDGIVENGSGATGASTLTLAGSGVYSFGGLLCNSQTTAFGVRTLALVKSGSGTQKLAGVNTYTAGTTVNGGTLRANGGVVATSSQTGTTGSGSATVTALTSTAGLVPGQLVSAASGVPASTYIIGILSSTSLTLSATATANGARTLTFGPVGATGSGTVAVNAGTLGGSGGIVGAVTVAGGATVDAGSDAATAGTLTVLDNVTLSNNSVLHVDISGATTADKLVVTGAGKVLSFPATWSITQSFVDGYTAASGEWTIAEVTGGATISWTAAPTCPTGWKVELQGSTVVLKKQTTGTIIILR